MGLENVSGADAALAVPDRASVMNDPAAINTTSKIARALRSREFLRTAEFRAVVGFDVTGDPSTTDVGASGAVGGVGAPKVVSIRVVRAPGMRGTCVRRSRTCLHCRR
jgi:hypothetical protein